MDIGGGGGLHSMSMEAPMTLDVSAVAFCTLPFTISCWPAARASALLVARPAPRYTSRTVKRGVSGIIMRAYMVSMAGKAPKASTMCHTKSACGGHELRMRSTLLPKGVSS